MTTSESYQSSEITHVSSIDADQFRVEKQIRWTDNDIVQIEFHVTSERTSPVRFRLADPLPAEFPADRVGFHADYGRDDWHIEDGALVVYESELAPGEELLTIYAIRPQPETTPQQFASDPSIEATEGSEATDQRDDPMTDRPDDTSTEESMTNEQLRGATDETMAAQFGDGHVDEAGGSRAAVDSDADSGTDGGLAAPESDTDAGEPAVDSGAVGPADRSGDSVDSAPPSPESQPASDPAETTDADEEPLEGTDSEGLVAALADELEEGDLAASDLERLRDQLLDGASGGRAAQEARLRRVEGEVNELVAYTDALEAFLDENGTGQAVLNDLTTQVGDLEATIEGHLFEVDEFRDRLSAVEDRQEQLAAVDERLEAIETQLGGIQDQVDETATRATQARDDVAVVSDRVDDVEDEVVGKTDDLGAELESLAEDVAEIRTWHRRFARVINDFAMFVPQGDEDEISTEVPDES